MEAVVALSIEGRVGAALDVVFDGIDERLLQGRFEECGAILREVDPARLKPAVAVGFLAITRAADDRLSEARLALRDRIVAVYRELMSNDALEQLLRGL